MLGDRNGSFRELARITLEGAEVFARINIAPTLVLERIARGAGATRWYWCTSEADLRELATRVAPGSNLQFYFDGNALSHAPYSADLQRRIEAFAHLPDICVGRLKRDDIEIEMDFLGPSEVSNLHSMFSHEDIVFYGDYPSGREAGCVLIDLPDADGVLRRHPH